MGISNVATRVLVVLRVIELIGQKEKEGLREDGEDGPNPKLEFHSTIGQNTQNTAIDEEKRINMRRR